MLDRRGREVDLHPLAFDESGNGWQQLSNTGAAWGRYEAKDLSATGSIADQPVRRLSPELELEFHRGYAWTAKDQHDMELLAWLFGLSLRRPAREVLLRSPTPSEFPPPTFGRELVCATPRTTSRPQGNGSSKPLAGASKTRTCRTSSSLDQVQPAARRRCEVQLKARVLGKPTS